MVIHQMQLLLMFLAAVTIRVSSIMVPTGKIGPITPPKALAVIVNPMAFKNPAPVWENFDESGSPYKAPVYNYVLYDYVTKYGHHTLIPRPEDYYNPNAIYRAMKPTYYGAGKSTYYGNKNKYHYSPLQFL